MSYQIKWIVPSEVLLVTLGAHVDWNDYVELNDRLIEELNSKNFPVDLVINASQVQRFPTDMKALEKINDYLRHPNLRWLMLSGQNKVLRLVMTVVCHKVDQHIYFYDSLGDALNSLQTPVNYS
jgi:hypothetical protein